MNTPSVGFSTGASVGVGCWVHANSNGMTERKRRIVLMFLKFWIKIGLLVDVLGICDIYQICDIREICERFILLADAAD